MRRTLLLALAALVGSSTFTSVAAAEPPRPPWRQAQQGYTLPGSNTEPALPVPNDPRAAQAAAMANDPSIQAKFSAILTPGTYQMGSSPKHHSDRAHPASMKALQKQGCFSSKSEFLDALTGSGHPFSWNDRPAGFAKPQPNDAAGWAEVDRLFQAWPQLALVWRQQGKLGP